MTRFHGDPDWFDRLTRRGQIVVVTLGILVFLFLLALVGGIEQGTL